MESLYDVCVIGAGVVGSSAAYSLSKTTNNVLLLEQFPVPHTRGSSHGQSRIIRCLYPDHVYSKMTYDAFPIWKEVEKQFGETLLIENGMLEIYNTSNKADLKNYLSALDYVGVTYDILTGEEVNNKFPLFDVPKTFSGIYEHGGGMLIASKCVAALQKVFVSNGGHFQDTTVVEQIIPGEVVTIKTNRGEFKAKSIIIAAGSFTSKLTNSLGLHLPLTVERTHPLYWKLDDPSSGMASNNFPSFIFSYNNKHRYGLASYEYPGYVKICDHTGIPVDPEKPNVEPNLSSVTELVKDYMKGIEHKPSFIETCLYTTTPDHHFIIDYHPRYNNIVIGAGFSGHGFKMAPTTGNILAELATGVVPKYDLSMLKINRFNDTLKGMANL